MFALWVMVIVAIIIVAIIRGIVHLLSRLLSHCFDLLFVVKSISDLESDLLLLLHGAGELVGLIGAC